MSPNGGLGFEALNCFCRTVATTAASTFLVPKPGVAKERTMASSSTSGDSDLSWANRARLCASLAMTLRPAASCLSMCSATGTSRAMPAATGGGQIRVVPAPASNSLDRPSEDEGQRQGPGDEDSDEPGELVEAGDGLHAPPMHLPG